VGHEARRLPFTGTSMNPRRACLWAIGLSLLTGGCVEESFVHAPPSEVMYMPDKPVRSRDPLPEVAAEHFDQIVARYLADQARPIVRYSISLGFIGDEPLGRSDSGPSWTPASSAGRESRRGSDWGGTGSSSAAAAAAALLLREGGRRARSRPGRLHTSPSSSSTYEAREPGHRWQTRLRCRYEKALLPNRSRSSRARARIGPRTAFDRGVRSND
jgi:hypothetical protein